MREIQVRETVDNFLEEQAMLIAALVENYGMEDQLVSHLMDSFSEMREKIVMRLMSQDGETMAVGPTVPFQPHPAIWRFLQSLGSQELLEQH